MKCRGYFLLVSAPAFGFFLPVLATDEPAEPFARLRTAADPFEVSARDFLRPRFAERDDDCAGVDFGPAAEDILSHAASISSMDRSPSSAEIGDGKSLNILL